MSSALDFYKSKTNEGMRIIQSNSFMEIFEKHFNFDYITCVETGSSSNHYDNFGLLLGKICEERNGNLVSVDINNDYVEDSKKFYSSEFPNLKVSHHVDDSVSFLETYSGNANLYHFDSMDLDLFNPLPAMLHGWLEFNAIKDKAPSGTLCFFDDNWLKDTWIETIVFFNGQKTDDVVRTDINYEIIGKGGLVYHWIKQRKTDWELVGEHYNVGDNIKVAIKKK